MFKYIENKYKNSPILRSFIYYIIAAVLLYLSYKLLLGLEQAGFIDSRKNKGWVLVLVGVYLILGIALNILITRRLISSGFMEYHQFQNTVENIFRDKISFLIFWVFKYPIFLLKVAAIQRI